MIGIPRYVLFLNDLLNSLDTECEALTPVKGALKRLQMVASSLNEKKSHRENLEEMYRISNAIDIDFVFFLNSINRSPY